MVVVQIKVTLIKNGRRGIRYRIEKSVEFCRREQKDETKVCTKMWPIILQSAYYFPYACGNGLAKNECCVFSHSVLSDSMDYSPQGSSVHGILQARLGRWVALPSSRRLSWLRDQTRVSCMAGGLFTGWAASTTQRVADVIGESEGQGFWCYALEE